METALTTRENGNLVEAQPHSWASAPIDVYEGADEYIVFADVPGAKKEDIQLEFEGGELRIRAVRQIGEADWAGEFRRTFVVGRDVDVDRISAEHANGVLQVHLPKVESAKPRQIAIRSA